MVDLNKLTQTLEKNIPHRKTEKKINKRETVILSSSFLVSLLIFLLGVFL